MLAHPCIRSNTEQCISIAISKAINAITATFDSFCNAPHGASIATIDGKGLKWYGHDMCISTERIPKKMLTKPKRKRPREDPELDVYTTLEKTLKTEDKHEQIYTTKTWEKEVAVIVNPSD